LQIGGIRPSEILGMCDNSIESLMLDAAILSKLPKPGESKEMLTLAEEIRRKRAQIMARRLKYGS